jgi:hypothetical protein
MAKDAICNWYRGRDPVLEINYAVRVPIPASTTLF